MIIPYAYQCQAFDRLPESLVQTTLYAQSNPILVRREVNYAGCRADFVTPDLLIEVKKSTGTQQPHMVLGQLLYYQSCHRIQTGYRLGLVLLVYGSEMGQYASDFFTLTRREYGIRMWQLTSLKKGTYRDVDSGELGQWSDLSLTLPEPNSKNQPSIDSDGVLESIV